MKITSIRVDPLKDQQLPRLKGYARIALDHQLTINEIKIIQVKRGMCVEFPKSPDSIASRFETIAPLDQKTRSYFEKLILKAYRLNADYFLAEDRPPVRKCRKGGLKRMS